MEVGIDESSALPK